MDAHAHERTTFGSRSSTTTRTKLVIATIVTVAFVGIEFAAGVLSNSLALIGDAFHNLTDALALLLALGAIVLANRPPTPEKSYGYQRAGIVAANVNAVVLLGFTIYIFVEAWNRFRAPEQVDAGIMLWVSLVALGVNTGIAFWLHEHGAADVNVRSAVIHQAGDALSSLGVIVAALLIRWTGNLLFDPILSVVIGILVLWSAWGVFRESLNLLLDGTPHGIDPDRVSDSLVAIDGVFGVHHLHIWALGPSIPALSCHLQLGDVPLSATSAIIDQVNTMLVDEYGIVHTTIQPEYAPCDGDEGCC